MGKHKKGAGHAGGGAVGSANNATPVNAQQTASALMQELSNDPAVQLADTFEPDWIIQIDALVKGDMKGYEKYAHVYAHRLDLTREADSGGTSSLRMSGGVTGSPLLVVIPSAALTSGVASSLSKGDNIKTINLARVSLVGAKYVVQQEFILTNCFSIAFKTMNDETGLAFRYGAIEQKQTHYDQDGKKLGNDSFKHNMNDATAE